MSAIRIDHRHEAIKKTVDVYALGIEEFLNQDSDVTPDLWYVVVPDEIYRWGRTKSAPPVGERVRGAATLPKRTAKALLKQPSMFGEENEEAAATL